MSTAIIPGTRPEIIKMSPMIRELDHKRRDIVFYSGFNNHRELRGHREKQHRSVHSVYSVVYQLHSNSFLQNKFNNNKPQIMAPRVTPLEDVSTHGRAMRVRGVENPQGFGSDEKETLAVVLTERQERAIEYLRENVFITTRVYASLVDVSERQARYDLNDMVEKNLIIAQGATSTRKYHLRQPSAIFGQRRGRNESGGHIRFIRAKAAIHRAEG